MKKRWSARATRHTNSIERATLSAQQERQEILAQARQEAHDLVLRAQQQAQHELEEGRITLGQQVIDLALAAASRVMQENLDEDKAALAGSTVYQPNWTNRNEWHGMAPRADAI